MTVSTEDDIIALCVDDTGDGIGAHDLVRVWERFYRGEKSRSRAANGGNGAGLGLAIAHAFFEAHGGTVRPASAPGRGARFISRLPAGDASVLTEIEP